MAEKSTGINEKLANLHWERGGGGGREGGGGGGGGVGCRGYSDNNHTIIF